MNTFTIERLSNLLYIYFRFWNLIIRCFKSPSCRINT